MAEKQKGRRAYLGNFRKNSRGEYEYTGNTYYFRETGENSSENEFGRILREFWILALAAAAALCAIAGMAGEAVYVFQNGVGELAFGCGAFFALGATAGALLIGLVYIAVLGLAILVMVRIWR